MSFAGFGPTELRILLAAGAIKVAAAPTVELMDRHVLLLDVGGVVAAVGLGVAFVVSAIRNGIALYRAERPSPLDAESVRIASCNEPRPGAALWSAGS